MRTPKLLVAAITIAAVATVAGCASSPPVSGDGSTQSPDSQPAANEATPAASDLESITVVEKAFGRESESDYWWYVVVLENPNPDHLFGSAAGGVDVEAMSDDGIILDTQSDYPLILPGRTAVVGSFWEIGTSVIADLEIRTGDPSTGVTPAPGQVGSFSFESIEQVSTEWQTTVSGVVSGTFTEEHSNVRIQVIARSGDGTIIGGEVGYVDRLPVGGKVRFQVDFYDVMPAGTAYEVFASI